MWTVTVVDHRIPGVADLQRIHCLRYVDRCLSNLTLNRELLQNGVFKRLGRTQTNNRLGLDLNLLAGLGITAKARLAMCLYYAADIGDDKFSGGTLCFFNCKFE
jgi:hypothetical protein